MLAGIDQHHAFAHRLENSCLGLQGILLAVSLGDLRDIDHGTEDPAIRLHRTRTQLEITGPAVRIADDLVEVTRLARLHHMLKYFMHVSTVGRRRKILYRRADPAFWRDTVHRSIEKHALSLPVEQRE